jgi:hypothetical protein
MEETFDLTELLVNEKPGAINTHIDVANRLRAISFVEERVEGLKAMKKDYVAYYDERIAKQQQQIDFLKGQIEAFMANTNTKTLPTPVGVVSYGTRRSTEWPDDEALLAFSKEKGLAVTVIEKPIKTSIKQFINSTGEYPYGYREVQVPSLTIRRPKEEEVTHEAAW